jgi:hypothetical protein
VAAVGAALDAARASCPAADLGDFGARRAPAPEPVSADDDDQPRFRATLAITLARAADAALFEVGERWGAVALVSGDFDDMFS